MEQDELARCEDELKAVKEENRLLREAATSFGDLAERLNFQLDRERRHIVDRRRAVRPGPDRRKESGPAGA